MFLTETEFLALEVGKSYDVIDVDYIQFLSIEYASQWNIEYNLTYDPDRFFNRLKCTITPTGKNRMVNVFQKRLMCCDIKAKLRGDNVFDSSLYSNDGILSNGSGDGWTRYMLLDKAKNLPQFWFEKR